MRACRPVAGVRGHPARADTLFLTWWVTAGETWCVYSSGRIKGSCPTDCWSTEVFHPITKRKPDKSKNLTNQEHSDPPAISATESSQDGSVARGDELFECVAQEHQLAEGRSYCGGWGSPLKADPLHMWPGIPR